MYGHAVLSYCTHSLPYSKQVEPTVCPVKTRLLVSNYFKDQPSAQALTALFRMFVNELVNISQARGFGQPDGPSNYDEEALADIANKYGIVDKLASAWTTTLSHPQVSTYVSVTLALADSLTLTLTSHPCIDAHSFPHHSAPPSPHSACTSQRCASHWGSR